MEHVQNLECDKFEQVNVGLPLTDDHCHNVAGREIYYSEAQNFLNFKSLYC
jgi:hypothetical protein